MIRVSWLKIANVYRYCFTKDKNMNTQTLTKNHVLFVGDGSLFESGVTSILSRRSNALIHETEYIDDLALINEIESIRPVVVMIVTESNHIVDLIFSTPSLVGLVLRIIILRYYDTTIDIFDRTPSSRNGAGYSHTQIVDSTVESLLGFASRA
jgi:hypothetical protein